MLLHILRSPATEPCPFVALLSPSSTPRCSSLAVSILLLLCCCCCCCQRSNGNGATATIFGNCYETSNLPRLDLPRLGLDMAIPRCAAFVVAYSLCKVCINFWFLYTKCCACLTRSLICCCLLFAFSFAVVVAIVVVVVAQHKCHWLSHIAWAYKSHCWGVSRRRSWSWRCLLPLTLYQFSLSPSASLSLPLSVFHPLTATGLCETGEYLKVFAVLRLLLLRRLA